MQTSYGITAGRAASPTMMIQALMIAAGAAMAILLAIDKPLLAAAVVPGLAVVIAVLRSPILGLYGIALSVPIDVAGNLISLSQTFNISIAWIFTSLTLASWIVNSFVEKKPPVITREIGIWLLYLGLGCASLITALEFDRGLEEVARTVQNILFFTVIINLITTRKRLKTVLILLVVSTVLTFAYAIAQKFLPTQSFDERALQMLRPGAATFGIEHGKVDTQGYNTIDRATGTTAHANVLALNCCFMLPFLFAYLRRGRSSLDRVAAWSSVLITLTAFSLTFSRGGFLTLGFTVLLLVLVGLLEVTTLRLILVAVGVLVALPLLPPGYIERVLSPAAYMEANSGSLSGRLGLWGGAVRAMLDHPLGLGIGNERGLFTAGYWKPEMAEDPYQLATTMNTFTQIGMEVGIIGVVLYVTFQIVIFRRLFAAKKAYRERGETDMVTIGWALVVVLASCLVAWMAIEFLRMGAKNVWIILGCTVAYYRLSRIAPAEAPIPDSAGADRSHRVTMSLRQVP